MADGVLGLGVHFAEGQGAAGGQENRVIAEAVASPGRPDNLAANETREGLAVAIGPRQRQDADEAGATVGIVAQGGMVPYLWGISAGQLPPGLTLGATGVITGTPTTKGDFAFTVIADDSSGTAAVFSQSYTMHVK